MKKVRWFDCGFFWMLNKARVARRWNIERCTVSGAVSKKKILALCYVGGGEPAMMRSWKLEGLLSCLPA